MKEPFTKKMDKVFTEFEKSNPAAHALFVIQNEEIIYQKVVGEADIEHHTEASTITNFRMASVSKQFTAAAILMLEKQGKLSLDQPLTDFFPDFAAPGKLITLRHLLTHTSGIVDYEEIMPDTLQAQLLDTDVLALVEGYDKVYFPAGSEFRYSNTGFCLLALVVEKVSGQPYASFVEQEIFTPLEMLNSRVFEPGKDIPERAFGYALDEAGKVRFSDQSTTSATKGDGGVYTSLEDYRRWYNLRQEKLGIDFPAAFSTCEAPLSGSSGAFYGLGWFFLPEGTGRKKNLPLTMYHSGSTCGFSNDVVEIPAEQTLVVFFSNLADNHAAFKPVLKVLEDAGILPSEMDLWGLHEKTN